jgi:hypothetical protein
MLLSEMKTDEQHLFLKSVAHALQTDEAAFLINFDDVWGWVGFSRKDEAESLLKNCPLLLEGEDFCANRTHNKDTIMMTLDAFRTLCMVAGTPKGKQAYQCFRIIERTMLKKDKVCRKMLSLNNFHIKPSSHDILQSQYEMDC